MNVKEFLEKMEEGMDDIAIIKGEYIIALHNRNYLLSVADNRDWGEMKIKRIDIEVEKINIEVNK